MRSVEVARPDGELVGVDAVADPDRAAAGSKAPGALVHPLNRNAHSPVVGGGELLEVPGEFADQVAAGGPHREEELQRVGGGEESLHLEEVRVGAGHRDAVTDPFGHPSTSSRNQRIHTAGCETGGSGVPWRAARRAQRRRSRMAPKKPSVPCRPGEMRRKGTTLTLAPSAGPSRSAGGRGWKSGWRWRNQETTASFSSSRRLHVP